MAKQEKFLLKDKQEDHQFVQQLSSYLQLQRNTVFLSKIILEKLKLSEKNIKSLVSFLSLDIHVDTVSLAHNKLESKDISPLFNAKLSPTIRQLLLQNNRLRDDGARILGRFAQNHINISYIDISENGVGDRGIVQYVSSVLVSSGEYCMSMNRNFPILKVGNNSFSNVGLQACLKSCMLNTSVRELDLSGSTGLISIEATRMLTLFLRINTNVRLIDLRDTSLEANHIQTIHKALASSGCPKTLRMGKRNSITCIKTEGMSNIKVQRFSKIEKCYVANLQTW